MLKNKMCLGIILSIILMVFSINGFAAYYKYTQESGANFYVGTGDKADALEDTNQIRQILDDLGNLLGHSKRNDLYPKDGTTGGTLSTFNNYYLKTAIDSQGEVETIWGVTLCTDSELTSALTDYYLKTAIDTQGEMETIWGVTLATDTELAALTYSDVGAEQADAGLTSLAGLTYASNSFIKVIATDVYAIRTIAETKTDLALNNVENLKVKLDGTAPPAAATDDVTLGYAVGSRWFDITNDKEYVCLDNTDGAAVWTETTGAGGGASTFVALTDTPANYTGSSLKHVRVNVGETALEFVTLAGGGDMLKATYDTDDDGDVDVAAGGTEKSLWTLYAIPYLSGTTAFGEIPIGTDNYALTVNGATGYDWTEFQTPLTFGIADTNKVQINSATVIYNDYAKFTATGLEGRSYAEVLSDIGAEEDLSNEAGLYAALSDVTLFLEDVIDDTTPQLGGDLDMNEKNLIMDSTLTSDHNWSGITEVWPVGETVVFGDLLYFNFTDKEWKKIDADAAATMPGLRIALEGKADGQNCKLLIKGFIRDDTWAFTASMVYASCTAGGVTSTAPSASGDQVQRVGIAVHADKMFFDPSIDVGEI